MGVAVVSPLFVAAAAVFFFLFDVAGAVVVGMEMGDASTSSTRNSFNNSFAFESRFDSSAAAVLFVLVSFLSSVVLYKELDAVVVVVAVAH
jgi:hypothetical protein